MKEICKKIVCVLLIKKINLKKNIKIGRKTRLNFNTVLSGNNAIGKNNIISNSKIGYGTYIGDNNKLIGSNIGKYCSLASDIRIVFGKHPTTKFVSTHPAFFSIEKQAGFTYVKSQLYNENNTVDKDYNIIIGNDVWIGESVSIMSGIKIGNGSIIGANSLVTKNCDPYYIYGGIPAKKIGQRFTDYQIAILEELKWWDKDESWIVDNIEKFENIDNFVKEYENV